METKNGITEEDLLLNEKDVAKIFGVTTQCLQKWRMNGHGGPPYIAISNRCVRYRKKDVFDWIESKRTKNAEKEL